MPPRSGYQGRRPARRPGGRGRPTDAARTAAPAPVAAPAAPRTAVLPSHLTVRELSEALTTPVVEVIKVLLKNGVFANVNQTVDYDTAAVVAVDLGFETEEAPRVLVGPETATPKRFKEEDGAHLRHRPPVVTIMGHVDHGKTSLLDAIRSTNVTEREAGGITQHIGAYQVQTGGHRITFLDTPGHEAFTAMRARGAHVTDIAIIVVAADDGIMPQTVEAIDHAKAAAVPIIVAINKIDRPDANQDRVKRQLSENGLLIEEWGGDTICVSVSAKTKDGIPDLLEHILLVAEVEDLKANPARRAEGMVIEAQLDPQRGPMSTLLVQTGTLRLADIVIAGHTYGRIRAMYDEHGHQVKRAEPAAPVKVLGLSGVPQPGDLFSVMTDERLARTTVEDRMRDAQRDIHQAKAITLEDLFDRIQSGQVKELNVVLKTDVQGSIDPIRSSLSQLGDETLRVKVLHAAPGNVTESDVMLALASNGIVLSFNTRVEPGARRLADVEGAEIRNYDVIYQVVEDVEKALKGLLEPTFVEVVDGHAQVRQLFKIGRKVTVAGCGVTDGKISRSSMVRVFRDRKQIAEDKISNLKRFKDEVRDVATGFECGITLENFMEFQEGDVVEAYRKERVVAE